MRCLHYLDISILSPAGQLNELQEAVELLLAGASSVPPQVRALAAADPSEHYLCVECMRAHAAAQCEGGG